MWIQTEVVNIPVHLSGVLALQAGYGDLNVNRVILLLIILVKASS